jgi:catechol 2,3-dioxygenase-like lactoylglutathione lyase family enzyme
MLAGLSWLALEVKSIEAARGFYGGALSMRELDSGSLPGSLARGSEQVAYAAGDTALVCRRPTTTPRGGLHTHFALSIPRGEYDDWWQRLESDGFALDEHVFGDAKSLYCYDPDGNCVELGQRDVPGPGIDGVFEVVLEVTDLDRAESFYAALGFETVDRGADRTRIRMDGPMALELWEPHLGLADARGGVHVDLGFTTPDPDRAVDAIADQIEARERVTDTDSGTDTGESSTRERASASRVRDPDGHAITFHEP